MAQTVTIVDHAGALFTDRIDRSGYSLALDCHVEQDSTGTWREVV